MPFKPGQSGNPKGMPPVKQITLKWEEIDRHVAIGTKWIATVIDETDPDIKLVSEPAKKLEIKIKATQVLFRLAPQRQVGGDGGAIQHKVEMDAKTKALVDEFENKLRQSIVDNP